MYGTGLHVEKKLLEHMMDHSCLIMHLATQALHTNSSKIGSVILRPYLALSRIQIDPQVLNRLERGPRSVLFGMLISLSYGMLHHAPHYFNFSSQLSRNILSR